MGIKMVLFGLFVKDKSAIRSPEIGVIEKFCDRLGARFPKLFGRLQSKHQPSSNISLSLQGSPSLDQLLAQFPSGSERQPETRQAKKMFLSNEWPEGLPARR
jgi:hypothetical protein